MSRTTYVYCPVTKQMVEKGQEQQLDPVTRAPMIIAPLKPFISPITGKEITCREQLRRHNREHGVTNVADYSPEWMEKATKDRLQRLNGSTPRDRQERIEALQHAISKGH